MIYLEQSQTSEKFIEIIKKRSSVRNFSKKPLLWEMVEKLIEAARWAPSAGNIQPWYFYVVTGEKRKKELALAALGQHFIAEAPACIIVCAEPHRSARIYGERGKNLYCLQDTAAAIQNILLAAEAYGLGACWVGAFDEKKVEYILNLPFDRRPVALVPVGYPARQKEKRTSRKELVKILQLINE